jgi:uncharacterized protein (DUF302 family)
VSNNGLITVASRFGVGETLDRLMTALNGAGLRVFARINHANNAEEVGMKLRPTELLIFGHPKGGTPLMQDKQTAGIDLPVKALAWEDEEGRVWLRTTKRHGLPHGMNWEPTARMPSKRSKPGKPSLFQASHDWIGALAVFPDRM